MEWDLRAEAVWFWETDWGEPSTAAGVKKRSMVGRYRQRGEMCTPWSAPRRHGRDGIVTGERRGSSEPPHGVWRVAHAIAPTREGASRRAAAVGRASTELAPASTKGTQRMKKIHAQQTQSTQSPLRSRDST